MENKTKEKILQAALVSFAENGYKETNLRDLAAGLGLSKSALYRHYDSKEAIRDAVIDAMESYYNERFGSAGQMSETPRNGEELLSLTKRMLDFTLHDSRVILTRRLLLREQFHSDRVRAFATKHFLTDTKEIYTGLFAAMMREGVLKKDDPAMLAFAFTAPITALVHLCDREPEREQEILSQIEAFVRHFYSVYSEP